MVPSPNAASSSRRGFEQEDVESPSRVAWIPQKYKCYKNYIFRIMKSMDPELRISNQAMEVMNGLIQDHIHKIAQEAATVAERNKQPFIDVREIRTAVRLTLPGDLGKHAVSLGDKAWHQLMNSED
ncbi:hypothetical protein R1flu_002411 [Riccia fluitans]|uniref:Core Histone H2A/H2B/H3 domain-containing protein n=1 Tax=Riccia fluitans TaxID=41844 RepID=A0ABD1Y612_9MARC